MANNSEKTELLQVAEIFQRHGVEYIVIGGQAETLHGSPRVTFDIDLCYRRTPENLIRLVAAMEELQPTLRGAPEGLPFKFDLRAVQLGSNFTFNTNVIDLDLLGFVEPIGSYDDLLSHAETYPAAELLLPTISLDDLLKVKLHINRVKDQESILQLKAIKRLREEDARKGSTA